jgi:hypothetical protein
MDEFVARLNIDHYRKVLAAESDEAKRTLLRTLLANEETRLDEAKHEQKTQSIRP